MKICEIIQEDEDDEVLQEQAEDFINMIHRQCKPYITKNPRHDEFQLLRGYNGLDFEEDKFAVLKTRMNRKPLNTPEKLHNTMIQAFIKAGFKAHRGNSLFCSGSMRLIRQYGEPCVIYPIGDFNFSWSRSVVDFYNQWSNILYSTKITNLDEIMNMDRDATKKALRITNGLIKTINNYPALYRNPRRAAGDIDIDLTRELSPIKGALNITAKDIEQLGRYVTANFTGHLVRALQSKGVHKDEILSKADFSFPELQSWVRENYIEDNIEEAIRLDMGSREEARAEIMVNCDEAIYVEWAFFRDYVIPLLNKT